MLAADAKMYRSEAIRCGCAVSALSFVETVLSSTQG
jgi:hypothetical protein